MGYWKKKILFNEAGYVVPSSQMLPFILDPPWENHFKLISPKARRCWKKSPKINAAGSVYGTILSEPNYILGQ